MIETILTIRALIILHDSKALDIALISSFINIVICSISLIVLYKWSRNKWVGLFMLFHLVSFFILLFTKYSKNTQPNKRNYLIISFLFDIIWWVSFISIIVQKNLSSVESIIDFKKFNPNNTEEYQLILKQFDEKKMDIIDEDIYNDFKENEYNSDSYSKRQTQCNLMQKYTRFVEKYSCQKFADENDIIFNKNIYYDDTNVRLRRDKDYNDAISSRTIGKFGNVIIYCVDKHIRSQPIDLIKIRNILINKIKSTGM